MARNVTYTESRETPDRDEIVSFFVVCQPQGAKSLDEYRDKLELNTLDECLPQPGVQEYVSDRLRSLGFEVLLLPESPDVPARGTVDRFESVFATQLDKRVRTTQRGQSTTRQQWFVVRDGAPQPSVAQISGALFVTLPQAPLFSAPLVPPVTSGFVLRPADIALLTQSSATHRLVTPGGAQATGGAIGVAVIDTGFYPHPFYTKHRYSITRAAVGGGDPAVDPFDHGTAVLANVLACAPDACVFAIKPDLDMETAIDLARTFPIKVLSASWGFDFYNDVVIRPDLLTLKSRILKAVKAGITVVFPSGNGGMDFPALLPDILAVGGVAVSPSDGESVWSGESSFRHPTIYPTRNVPDICGVASPLLLPFPPCATGPQGCWDTGSATSFAAPQVAGICALLVQKNPALTPSAIRAALVNNGEDITSGSSLNRPPKMPQKTAGAGPDDATGGGLVNALKAWQAV